MSRSYLNHLVHSSFSTISVVCACIGSCLYRHLAVVFAHQLFHVMPSSSRTALQLTVIVVMLPHETLLHYNLCPKPFTVVDGEWRYVLGGTVPFCFMKHGPVN